MWGCSNVGACANVDVCYYWGHVLMWECSNVGWCAIVDPYNVGCVFMWVCMCYYGLRYLFVYVCIMVDVF